jgi:hypothetical protein
MVFILYPKLPDSPEFGNLLHQQTKENTLRVSKKCAWLATTLLLEAHIAVTDDPEQVMPCHD